MSSRRLCDLHPDLRPLAEEFVAECQADGVDVLIYQTYRSEEEQNDLFAQGRTKPGRIVTNARGGKSAHNFTIEGRPAAKAFDAVPLRKTDGKSRPVWNDPVLWNTMGRAAEKIGLKWGGNWKKFVDKPHFYID